jgi:hypothetical protein
MSMPVQLAVLKYLERAKALSRKYSWILEATQQIPLTIIFGRLADNPDAYPETVIALKNLLGEEEYYKELRTYNHNLAEGRREKLLAEALIRRTVQELETLDLIRTVETGHDQLYDLHESIWMQGSAAHLMAFKSVFSEMLNCNARGVVPNFSAIHAEAFNTYLNDPKWFGVRS